MTPKRAAHRRVTPVPDPLDVVEALLDSVEIAAGEGQHAVELQHAGHQLNWRPDRIIPAHCERPPDGRQALAEVAAGVAEPAEGAGEGEYQVVLAGGRRELEGRAQVGVIGGNGVHRRGLGIRAHLRLDPRRNRRVVPAVPVARRVLLALFCEQFGRVLAQTLEHRELGGAVAVAAPDQALLDERGHAVHHVGHLADLLRRVQRPPSDEHRRPAEQGPLIWAQQIVAPRQRRPQRPVPVRTVAGPAGQQPHAVPQAERELARGEQVQAGRRELQGERKPVEPDANLRH
jgi:hypothetical protein